MHNPLPCSLPQVPPAGLVVSQGALLWYLRSYNAEGMSATGIARATPEVGAARGVLTVLTADHLDTAMRAGRGCVVTGRDRIVKGGLFLRRQGREAFQEAAAVYQGVMNPTGSPPAGRWPPPAASTSTPPTGGSWAARRPPAIQPCTGRSWYSRRGAILDSGRRKVRFTTKPARGCAARKH